MDALKNNRPSIGIFLGCAGAITTGIFGIFFNYFDIIGLSEGGRTILTPFLVFIGCFSMALIKNPKALIPKKRIYFFTMIVISGGVLYSTYNYAYVKAIENLPLAIASLFNFSNAIVLVFLMRLFFKEKVTGKKIICCLIGLAGILLVLEVFTGGNEGITSIGIFWGVAVTISLAFAYSIDYFHISKEFPFYVVQTYTCLGAIMMYSLNYSLVDLYFEIKIIAINEGVMLWGIIFLYFINVVISYGATTASYNFIDASYTSMTYVLEPTVAAVAGFFLFGELLSTGQMIGMAISVGAIVYMQYIESKGSKILLGQGSIEMKL